MPDGMGLLVGCGLRIGAAVSNPVGGTGVLAAQ
jgi:hypothetical protein